MKDNKAVLDRLRKKITLEMRLEASNTAAFIDLITDLGYRESKPWSSDEDDLLNEIVQRANKLAKQQLAEIEKWKKGNNSNL